MIMSKLNETGAKIITKRFVENMKKKTIKLKSIDLVQSKVKCDFPYTHVSIKKLLHTPTGLFILGNHVRGKQSSKSYRDLRTELSEKIKECCEDLLGGIYTTSLLDCTNSNHQTEGDSIIASAWYKKIKQAIATKEKDLK